jgi:hypothetical protein
MRIQTKLSNAFRVALRMSDRPQYQLAIEVGLPPTTLSKLAHGAMPPDPDDKRLIELGALLGLRKEELFTTEDA